MHAWSSIFSEHIPYNLSRTSNRTNNVNPNQNQEKRPNILHLLPTADTIKHKIWNSIPLRWQHINSNWQSQIDPHFCDVDAFWSCPLYGAYNNYSIPILRWGFLNFKNKDNSSAQCVKLFLFALLSDWIWNTVIWSKWDLKSFFWATGQPVSLYVTAGIIIVTLFFWSERCTDIGFGIG